jgi:hypothetical protein
MVKALSHILAVITILALCAGVAVIASVSATAGASVAIAALLYGVACVIFRLALGNRKKVSPGAQSLAEKLLRSDDSDEEDEEDAREGVYTPGHTEVNGKPSHYQVPKRRRLRYVRQLRLIAHAEFGLMRRTEANRLVAQKFLRDHMRSKFVRERDIALILPLAVEMAFTANDGHLAAREERETIGVRENAARMYGSLDGFTFMENLWGWFGIAPAPRVGFTQ